MIGNIESNLFIPLALIHLVSAHEATVEKMKTYQA